MDSSKKVKIWRGTREAFDSIRNKDYWTRYSVKENDGTWTEYYGNRPLDEKAGEVMPVLDIVEGIPSGITYGDRYLLHSGNTYYIVERGINGTDMVSPLGKRSVRVASHNMNKYCIVDGVLTNLSESSVKDYEPTEYSEDFEEKIDDKDAHVNNGDTMSEAFKKIETTISTLVDSVIENEKIESSALIQIERNTVKIGPIVDDDIEDIDATIPNRVAMLEAELHGMINVTYEEINNLIYDGSLLPGSWYRITDFVTRTWQDEVSGFIDEDDIFLNYKSAQHPFDIIVHALDETHIASSARAIWHEGDTYFSNEDLPSWKIEYSLSNGYSWSDDESGNGKGTILWMEDEFHNSCYYDFKNIMFVRGENFYPYDYIENWRWYYTFSKIVGDECFDDSLSGGGSNNNHFGLCTSHYENDNEFAMMLSNNVCGRFTRFATTKNECFGWTCGNECFGWTCGYECSCWTCGHGCSRWTCGNYSNNWSCGEGCDGWSCGNNCAYWNCWNYCHRWTCGNDCSEWSCGDYSSEWTCGNYCNGWTCGNECYNWTCGNESNEWSCGNECSSWTCGNGCSGWTCGEYSDSWTCGNDCYGWSCGNNCSYWNCGNECYYWSCGDYCQNWDCGEYCQYWICGNECNGWTCGNDCSTWTCGEYSNSWTCGNNCTYWNCGNYSNNWSCGNNCAYWTCGNYCFNWSCGNYCDGWNCGNHCCGWSCGNECREWQFKYSYNNVLLDYVSYFTINDGCGYFTFIYDTLTDEDNLLMNLEICYNGSMDDGFRELDISEIPLNSIHERIFIVKKRSSTSGTGMVWGSIGELFDRGIPATCLLKGTMIATPNGIVPIEDLKIGDIVLSLDVETQEIVERVITNTRGEKEYNKVKRYKKYVFSDGTIINVAYKHELYNVEKKCWRYLDDWNIGDHAYTIDGKYVEMVSREEIEEEALHYTLFLEGDKEGKTMYFANGLLAGDRYCPKNIVLLEK